MKRNKKILSVLAGLALSGAMVAGAVGVAACSASKTPEKKQGAVAIDTAIGVAYSQSNGKTYYVSPTGKSEDPGTSIDAPCRIEDFNYDDTNGRAGNKTLAPGDTVWMLPGTYNLSDRIIFPESGAYNNYIRIMNAGLDKTESGYTGDETKVTIDFSDMLIGDSNRGVQIYGNYYYWRGVDVCGAGDNGLFIAGSYNTVDYSEFYNNRDSGFQLGRQASSQTQIEQWPSYNLIKNCTSHNNYDNEGSLGENADGFAAKLTIGYGNVFDGCIAYRNSDDGWDLYAYSSNGNIGQVIIYNCVAYENGYLEYTQKENNARFKTSAALPVIGGGAGTYFDQFENGDSYLTNKGDGNGFKLGGSVMEGDVKLYNCLSFNNRMHGVTDNSNPGFIISEKVTSYDNGALIDDDSTSARFGKISDVANYNAGGDTHNNIDVSRHNYSYNSILDVLSIDSGFGVGTGVDAYRGSARDSILKANDGANVIKGVLDADSKAGKGYTSKANALNASEVFQKLPVSKSGTDYTDVITGLEDLGEQTGSGITLNETRAHKKYRNSDESINMDGILEIKPDYSFEEYLGAGKTPGSALSKDEWSEYTHFVNESVMDPATSAEEATVLKAYETLQISVVESEVYQDFDVPTMMNGSVKVTWEVDENDYVELGEITKNDKNGTEFQRVYIYRPGDEDKTVVLKATLTCGSASKTKEFTLNVKQGTPEVGEIYVITEQGETIYDGGSYIVDQYALFNEPTIMVENGIDYNHKVLSEELYDVDYDYKFADNKGVHEINVKGFTPSNAGVFTVTINVSMKDPDNDSIGSMTYYIFVASPAAKVDFDLKKDENGNDTEYKDYSVTINRDGYNISGALNSATGILYGLSSAEKLEPETLNIKDAAGVKSFRFRSESISYQFENTNSDEYYIYFAFANANDDITSEVYEVKVNRIDIETNEMFKTVVGGGSIGDEDPATTIYMLMDDLDFSSETYPAPTKTFKGLLNGNGKTVSGISVSGGGNTGVFYKVSGTVENIKFKDITVTSTGNKFGIVAEAVGGYYHNIQILNADISGSSRGGILIGTASEPKDINISQVYIDKDSTVVTTSNRSGGIIGLVQSSGDGGVNQPRFAITISDCLVSAGEIKGNGDGVGGFIGEIDANGKYNGNASMFILNITSSMFNGSAWVVNASQNKIAGFVGNQKGEATLNIDMCASLGELYYGGTGTTPDKTIIDVGYKNAAPIIGGDVADSNTSIINVSNCIAYFEEYDTNLGSNMYSDSQLRGDAGIVAFKGMFDVEKKWTLVYANADKTALEAPYLQLNFLAN